MKKLKNTEKITTLVQMDSFKIIFVFLCTFFLSCQREKKIFDTLLSKKNNDCFYLKEMTTFKWDTLIMTDMDDLSAIITDTSIYNDLSHIFIFKYKGRYVYEESMFFGNDFDDNDHKILWLPTRRDLKDSAVLYFTPQTAKFHIEKSTHGTNTFYMEICK